MNCRQDWVWIFENLVSEHYSNVQSNAFVTTTKVLEPVGKPVTYPVSVVMSWGNWGWCNDCITHWWLISTQCTDVTICLVSYVAVHVISQGESSRTCECMTGLMCKCFPMLCMHLSYQLPHIWWDSTGFCCLAILLGCLDKWKNAKVYCICCWLLSHFTFQRK